jgi:ATP-dependent helicase/nuclease subunit A
VITFTEAAAAELAARVRQGLEEALLAAEGPERELIQGALRWLYRAHIETIHAFAANLLRERPVEARLDPAFEVLDELAAQLHFDRAYSDWQHTILSEQRAEVATAIRRELDVKQIRELVSVVHRYRSLLPLAPEHAPAADLDGFVERVLTAAAELRALLAAGALDEKATRAMEGVIGFAGLLENARTDTAWLERLVLFLAPRISHGAGAQKHWEDANDCRRSKTLRREVREDLARTAAALRTEAIVGIMPLAADFVDSYERARREAGKADFDDLLEWARDLLADSPEARAYFRGRFSVILIDEFQDTDPVQVDVALCIASDDEPGEEWLSMRPRPGSLTVVGDPKQSIYRFRRADIAVYDAVRHGPLAGGEVQLVQNFRSIAGVIEWLNKTFDRILQAKEGVQPANTPLAAGPYAIADETRAVCVVHGEPLEAAAQIREAEADLLARTLRRALDEGWPVRDRDGSERPARAGDITMLVPGRTSLDTYLDALHRAGIPVRSEGGRSFFQRQEVRDLSSVLASIDDPLDQVALVSSLRSSAFACTDEELFLYVDSGNRFDYRIDPAEGSPANVCEALALLKDLNDFRSRVSLTQLVRATLERTRLVEIALAGWDGQQAAANLVKLADQARAFSSSGGGGLRAFAQWLDEQQGASSAAEASIAEESDDVARVMTIHASKGLEFPIVALANLATKGSSRVEPVADRSTRRLHVRVRGGDDAEFATPGFGAAWQGEQEQLSAERDRLLYVATTRARDHLVIAVTAAAAEAGPMLNSLRPSLPPGDPELRESVVEGCFVVDPEALGSLPEDEPPLAEGADEASVDSAIAEREAWTAARAKVMSAARDELEVHPATGDEGDDPIPAALLGADDAPLIAGQGLPAEKGEALHRILELVDLRAPDDLDEIARSVCTVAGLDEHVDEVLELTRACLASEALARALRTRQIWSEVPYTLRVEDGYATGRIDLVFEEDGELVVLDWKSDSIGPKQAAAAAELHRPQAEAYARALGAATGMSVKEVVFVFPRAKAAAAISFEADDAAPSSRLGIEKGRLP